MNLRTIFEESQKLKEDNWGFQDGAYWYLDGEFLYLDRDEFHHQYLVRNSREFGLYNEIQEIASEFGFDYDLDGFAETLDLAEGVEPGEEENPIELVPDRVLLLAHNKGAIRVRPTNNHVWINSPKLNKKTINDLIEMICDDSKNFTATKLVYIEPITGNPAADRENSIRGNRVDVLNTLLEY